MEERLRKFAKLVETGSYTKAAKELHISQPALTSAIQKLEKELKAELLVRHGRGINLTPAGAHAYKTANDICQNVANLHRVIAEAKDDNPRINIGLIDSIADQLVSAKSRPSSGTSISVDNSQRLIEKVQYGELDFAIITKGDSVPKGLSTKDIGTERLYLVSAASYMNESRQLQLSKKILAGFIGYNTQSNTYKLIDANLRGQGYNITYSYHSTSPHIILNLVQQAAGMAVLPASLVEPFIKSRQLVQPDIAQPIGRPICAVFRDGAYLGNTYRTVCREVSGFLHLP